MKELKVEAQFALDKEGKPSIVAKCQMDVFETKGKFGCGFGLWKDNKTGELILFAFQNSQDNPIAFAKKTQAIEWLRKALEMNGYKWYHLYETGMQKVDGWYAFMVPFDAEGWNPLPKDVVEIFQKMIGMLENPYFFG